MQRIGVFVCHCGSNIAATVDVKKVVEIIAKEPGSRKLSVKKISQEWLSVPVLRVCMRQLSVKQRKRPA